LRTVDPNIARWQETFTFGCSVETGAEKAKMVGTPKRFGEITSGILIFLICMLARYTALLELRMARKRKSPCIGIVVLQYVDEGRIVYRWESQREGGRFVHI
jgi:hypothetical protein